MTAFGPYRPDQPITTSGVTRMVDGVVPIPDANNTVAYGPYPELSTPVGATALSEAPRGVISLTTSTGTNRVFVGQSTSIVEMDATWSPTDIDTGLSLTTSDDWSFDQIGAFLVGTNNSFGMWDYNVDTSSGEGAIAGAPTAREIFVTNEMLVALDVDGDNKRWANSALGDHTNWTSLEANADTLEDGGALIVGKDLSNGRSIVFQENAIRIFDFSNGSQFNVYKLADGIGSVGRRSVVAFNGVVYFLDTKGFFVTNGGDPIAIGEGKVDQTFLASLDSTELVDVRASVDPFNKLVMWYHGGRVLVYNWVIGEWSEFTETLTELTQVATPGYNVDNASQFGNVDTIPYPPDSRFWQGGAPSLGAFGADNKIAFFTGENRAATLDTGLINSSTSRLITSATPITDDLAATVAIGVTDQIGVATTFGSDIARQSSGRVPLRGRGKNIRFREKHAAGATWASTRGVEHSAGSGGGAR